MSISAVKASSSSPKTRELGFLSNGDISYPKLSQARSELTEAVSELLTVLSSDKLKTKEKADFKNAKNYAELAFELLRSAIENVNKDPEAAKAYINDALGHIKSGYAILEKHTTGKHGLALGNASSALLSARQKLETSQD